MKVLLINGSPHKNGATNRILEEVCKPLNEEGIETEIVHIGIENISGCLACGFCYNSPVGFYGYGVGLIELTK